MKGTIGNILCTLQRSADELKGFSLCVSSLRPALSPFPSSGHSFESKSCFFHFAPPPFRFSFVQVRDGSSSGCIPHDDGGGGPSAFLARESKKRKKKEDHHPTHGTSIYVNLWILPFPLSSPATRLHHHPPRLKFKTFSFQNMNKR